MTGVAHLPDTLSLGAHSHYWANQDILLLRKEE